MPHGVLRPHGAVIIVPAEGGPEIQRDTLQCCHCGNHWIVVPGSGRRRGFCQNCGQVTCGAADCDPCRPWERQMEEVERADKDARMLDEAMRS